MNIRLNIPRITTVLMILLVFLDMEPYFTWAQVSPLGYNIYTYTILLTTLAMVAMAFLKRYTIGSFPALSEKKKAPASLLLASLGFVVLIFYQIFLSGAVTQSAQPFNIPMIIIHVGLMAFCLQDHISLQKVYLVSKKIFAIVLIPAILIFILVMVGIPLPSIPLNSETRVELTGYHYELYMGVAVMLKDSFGEMPRLCGLFREPGFVGTVGGLFLLGDKLSLKKWENVIIIIAGICTFSVAFYAILIIGYLLQKVVSANTGKGILSGILALLLVVGGYLTFINLPLSPSSPFAELQERVQFTEDGLAGDNRMTDEYAVAAYESWADSGTKNILLGYGEDNRKIPGTKTSIWQKAHSIKEYIFSYGVLSLVIMVATFISVIFSKYQGVKGLNKRYVLVLLAVFILSIYQRYGVCTFFYICTLLGGASNLALQEQQYPGAAKPQNNT